MLDTTPITIEITRLIAAGVPEGEWPLVFGGGEPKAWKYLPVV
jgi:hypothetical protein